MALSEESEEEYHSLGSGDEPEDGEDDEESETMEPPTHPVLSMQGPFEESIVESVEDQAQPSSNVNPTAEARRQELLECKQYDDSWAARWKQKSSAQYHPLLKLMAQIIFGMHLLQQEQAKSEGEVVKILQTHVNEVDSFLERTAEDFNLAIRDIEERIRFLKLPMKHQDVFDIMLDDKKFRTQLLDGNDKIEKIIDRTSRAMKAALLDVQKGVKANKELGRYLESVSGRWPRDKRTIADVYGAMRGNEQGWKTYLTDLHFKGNLLGQKLVQLGTVIGEMSKLAAAASRRNKTQSKPAAAGSKSAPVSPGLRSKFSQEPTPSMPSSPSANSTNLNKPLPSEPQAVAGSSKTAAPQARSVPFAEKYERPRQAPPSPNNNTTNTASVVNGVPQRPKTAASSRQPREARAADARNDTADLAAFLKDSNPEPKITQSAPRNAHQNPLRSNPPDATWKAGAGAGAERKLERSTSQGADLLLTKVRVSNENNAGMSRSRSQGAMDILKAAESGKSQVHGKEEDGKALRSSSEHEEKREEKREIRYVLDTFINGMDCTDNLTAQVSPAASQSA